LIKYNLSTTNDSPYNVAMLQVTADSGKAMLGEQGVTGADLNLSTVELCINQTEQNVEFRGYIQQWQGNLTLSSIEVMRASAGVNETYPAYGLYSSYYLNGTVIGSQGEMAWYGPYTTLCPGNYTVTFWINGTGGVNLQVTANYGSKYLAAESVKGPGRYTLNFTITQQEQFVEFRGYVINGSVELQKVNVTG
ncbi:MAG: hypothetical protein QW837_07615, partial [Conexivisphaerales archaeon]